ncbi:MAG: MOSC domain-containing protein [Planctomycetaceae bacterium]
MKDDNEGFLSQLVHSVPQIGRVEWIGLSSRSRSNISAVSRVAAEAGTGLEGDHHSKRRPGGKRQVTLFQAEHLPVVAALVGENAIPLELLRRNIVVEGINLLSLKGLRFQIGGVLLEGTGSCDPCSRMEENLGPGGYQAMRGHGGLTARVVEAGEIRIGDRVQVVGPVEQEP